MNAFKSAIAQGRPQIGFWHALASPYTAEICAGAGFDWLLIDAEHGPNDVPLVLSQLQAVAGYPEVEPVVRIPVGDTVLVKQYLDIGARSLLVPMVESAAQAAELVRATRYPPHGVRGVGSAISRGSRFNRTAGYLQQADQEICLLVQVESGRAAEQAAEIAAVDGVSGVFIGPSDLAADLGHLGNPGHSDVQAMIERTIAAVLACDTPVGMLIADESLARRYLELGATFVAVGTDVTVLARGAEAISARFRSDLPAPSTDASGSVY